MDERAVVPDESLLKHIFPDVQPANTAIFVNDWDKCVFRVDFPIAHGSARPPCVVRVETQGEDAGNFATVAALQKIAATCIPGLIPETLQVGTAVNAKGTKFDFSVMEFVHGDTLNDVWLDMSQENQTAIVDSLIEALGKLQPVRLSDELVRGHILPALGQEVLRDAVLGGPHTGFLKDGAALFAHIRREQLKRPAYKVEPTTEPKGLLVKSNFDQLGSVTVTDQQMAQWPSEAVLCHNDINPRNIMIRSSVTSDGAPTYELAAIIDWELAGFYPPSYQLGLQDTYLGISNQYASFYLLLKQRLKGMAGRSPSQIALLQTNELIFESDMKYLGRRNVPATIRNRFMEIMGISRDKDPYAGWTRKEGNGPLPTFTQADSQKLEDDAIEAVASARAESKVPEV